MKIIVGKYYRCIDESSGSGKTLGKIYKALEPNNVYGDNPIYRDDYGGLCWFSKPNHWEEVPFLRKRKKR